MVSLGAVMVNLGVAVASRHEVHEAGNESDGLRMNLFLEGLQRCAERPLFGDQFIPAWDRREGALVDDVDRLFGSHNQYVDLALRGGFIYLFLFVGLLYKATCCGIRLTKMRRQQGAEHYVVLGVAGTSFLVSIAIESNFQLYFIQLLTAVPCMLLIGMLFQANRLIEKENNSIRPAHWSTPCFGQSLGLPRPARQPVAHGSGWAQVR
jgi:O-antigen ligase